MASVYLQENTAFPREVLLADKDGLVEINLNGKQDIQILVRHLGYLDKQVNLDAGTNAGLVLPVELRRVNVAQEEVIVSAMRKTVQTTVGGYVYAIDKSMAAFHPNAGEVLNRLPGVFTDQFGKYKLMGKEASLWVDGRPVMLSGEELAAFLRSLNTSDIKQIKVYTTPPAMYTASGSGGIIEVITVRNITNGLQGRVNLGIATHDKSNAGLSFNYRNKRYSGTYRFSYDRSNYFVREQNNQTNLGISNALSNYNYSSEIEDRPINSQGVQLQNDFAINPKSTLGIIFRYSGYHMQPTQLYGRMRILNEQQVLQESQVFNRMDENRSNVIFGNINYRKDFKRKGSNLILDMYMWRRNADSRFGQQLTRFDASNGLIGWADQRANNTTHRINGKSFSVTGNAFVSDSLSVSYGIRADQYAIDNALLGQYLPSNNGNSYKLDSVNTFQLVYDEKILAPFISLSGNFSKLQYRVGIRMETTCLNLQTTRFKEKTENDNTFTYLFPSLSVNFPLSAKVNMSLGYGKRINRVSYSQLNPLDLRRNPTVVVKGNPELLPSVSHNINSSISLNHSDALNQVISFSWSRYVNPYSWFLLPDAIPGSFVYMPKNHKAWTFSSVNFYQQFKPGSHTSVVLNLYAARERYNISDVSNVPTVPVNSWGGNISFTQRFWKNAGLEVFGNYRAPGASVFGKGFGMKHVDVAFFKNFGKNNTMTVSLRVNDIFDINQFDYENASNALVNNGYIKNETRFARLTFAYRFGTSRANKIKEYVPQEDTRLLD
ncbi:MAG: outer membrane beta-barrel protein [Dinghuibacter sp.]|nr:outer membrane beta-barrel protein [Dinghuibacter sp.]